MFFIIIILLILFAAAAILVLSIILWKFLQKNKDTGISEEKEYILDTLDRKLAAGEIRKDEHERISRLIRSSPAAGTRDKEK